ncbi:MAG: hypothetical protein AB1349_06045 [Elusimicrobiota bacterium]
MKISKKDYLSIFLILVFLDCSFSENKTVKLPRSMLGFELGQTIEEVDEMANKMNCYSIHTRGWKETGFRYYTDPSPLFTSLFVSCRDNKNGVLKVCEIGCTYSDKSGSYEYIISEAKKKFGRPKYTNNYKTEWYYWWINLWADDNTVVKIKKHSEVKSSLGIRELSIKERRVYIEDQQKFQKRQEEFEKREKEGLFGK